MQTATVDSCAYCAPASAGSFATSGARSQATRRDQRSPKVAGLEVPFLVVVAGLDQGSHFHHQIPGRSPAFVLMAFPLCSKIST